MRQGNFSELLTPSIFYSSAKILTDPNGVPYPGNNIPSSALSHNGLALITALPTPTPGYLNSQNQNWEYDYPGVYTHQRKDTPGMDWNITDKMQVRFRGQIFTNDNIGISSTYTNTIQDNPNKRGSINYVYTITPTWVNEALLTGSSDHVTTGLFTGPEGSFARSAYGFNYPYLFPTGKDLPDKIPSVAWSGSPFLALNGSPYPSHSAGPIEVFSDNVTHIYKQHTFKFGYYFEHSGENDDDQIVIGSTPGGTNNQAGQFSFSNTTPGGTGLDFANAAIGKFSTYAEVGARSFTPYRTNDNEWFFQDSWKVTPKLRLDLGIRYNFTSPEYSLWGNMAYFNPALYNPANAVSINPTTGNLAGTPTLQQIYNGVDIPGTGWPKAQAIARPPKSPVLTTSCSTARATNTPTSSTVILLPASVWLMQSTARACSAPDSASSLITLVLAMVCSLAEIRRSSSRRRWPTEPWTIRAAPTLLCSRCTS